MNDKIKSFKWAYQLAWKINKKMLITWNTLSVLISVLPAISLQYNKQVVAALSDYISKGTGAYSDIVPQILSLGFTLILIGVSARLNSDLVYMMMYDSYYIGMQEILIDSLNKVEITNLLKSDLNDEYNYIIGRAGSLTDLMSGSCTIIGKIVSIISLLIIAINASLVVFTISIIYVISILVVNFMFTEKVRWDTSEYRKISRVAKYYENLPFEPGTAKEIRVFENKDSVITLWKKAYREVKSYEERRNFQIELRNFISNIGFYIFLITMITYNIFQVSRDKMSVSIFLVLFTLCLNIFTAISGLARNIMSFDYGLFAINRQRLFFEKTKIISKKVNKICVPDKKNETVFCAKNICFSYNNNVMALKNINFDIKSGEVVAIVGKNGSGKTTLTKILLGMYKPSSGILKLYNKSYEDYTPDEIRKIINIYFQDFYLFHASIKENVSYGDIDNMSNEQKIMKAIHDGGADKLVAKLKSSINTIVGKKIYKEGVEMSGGEKQRIAVARAHMSDKAVIIFDEPASALDPIAEMEQFLNIREKLNGRTAILISHRVGFARLADKILMMEDGQIVECGTHNDLLKHNGRYKNFFNLQAQWYEKGAEETEKWINESSN